MSRVHKPATMRSEDREVGSTLSASIQNQELLSHQNGLSNNATETTGFTEPDDGDDRIQKESENVAHARMVSNRTSSRIQDARGIRLPHVRRISSNASKDRR